MMSDFIPHSIMEKNIFYQLFFHRPNQFPWCTMTRREFSPNLQIHSIITSQDWRIWNFNGRHLYYKITLNNNEVWNLRNVIDKYFQVRMFRHLTNIRGRVSREENRTKWLRDVSWLRWWRRSPALVGICPLGRGWDPTRVKLADVPTIPYHAIPYPTIPYHTIPYHTIPNHTIPNHTIAYHTIAYDTNPRETSRLPGNGRPRHYHITCPASLATTGMCPRQMMLFHSLTNIKLSTGGGRKPPSVHIYCTTDKLLLMPSHAVQYGSFGFYNVLLSSSTQEMSLKIKISESLWCALGMAHRQIVHE